MTYTLLATRNAQRQLDGLPPAIADGIRSALRLVAQDPHNARFGLKALRGLPAGREPILRLRIGAYRILLRIDDRRKEVVVARVGHRSDVYRGLDRLDA